MERMSKMTEKSVGEYAPSLGRADASPQAQTVTRKAGRRACPDEGEKHREMGSYAALPSGIAYEVAPCPE